MKKLSGRDWSIAIIISVLAFMLGFAVKGFLNKPNEIYIENPINESLKKCNDSLEAVVVQRNLKIEQNDKEKFSHDSTLIMNNRNLAKYYDKIKDMDDSTRAIYVEQALKRANIRR